MNILSNDELRKYREKVNGKMVYTKRSLVKIFDIAGSTEDSKIRKASGILSDLKNSYFSEWQGTDHPVKFVTREDRPKRNKIKIIDSDYFELFYDKVVRERLQKVESGLKFSLDERFDKDEVIIDMRKPLIVRKATPGEEENGIIRHFNFAQTKNIDQIIHLKAQDRFEADLVKEVSKKFCCDPKPAKMLIAYSQEIQRLKEVLYWVKHPDEYNEFMHEGHPDVPSDEIFDIKNEITDDMLPEEYEVECNGYKVLHQFGWHSDLLLDQ
ncbi:hypothetical protein [Ligilactobacillus sp. LYQ60]|uniref:hypothetical protein n=1 Tax=unclassified Ligilactobacillus TaxID=2767920 RepID=UPI0038521FF9